MSTTSAAVITFSDSTFNLYSASNPGGWSATTLSTPSGGSVTDTNATNGPNAAMSGSDPDIHVNVYFPGGASNGAQVYGFNLMGSATYTPQTQGAILSLNYSEARETDTTGQEFGPALMQNGIYYYRNEGYLPAATWTTVSDNSITQSSFSTAETTTLTTPDFSANGSKITFGFVTINSTPTSNQFSTNGYYDNYSVSLTTAGVPEPACLGLISIGGLLLCRGTNRRLR